MAAQMLRVMRRQAWVPWAGRLELVVHNGNWVKGWHKRLGFED